MATYNAPRLAQFAGMPSQSSDSILGYIEGLITGESPLPVVLDLPLAQSQTIPAYTPVGYSSGVLVPAVQGTTQAIGITLYDVTVGAVGAGGQGHPILIQASVSRDIVAWPASYDTNAKKFAAFNGAPSPTNIVVREAYYGSVVVTP